MGSISTLSVLALALLSQSPAPPSPKMLALDPAKSTLTYGIVHKLHKVSAECKAVEGKAALLPDGKVQLMVRAPVSAFKSGDANRDEHMQEVLETGKYGFVTFKAVAQATPPSTFPATTTLTVSGQLDFHGRKRTESVPLQLEWSSPTEVRVKTTFTVSLDAYEVQRPSLLFMKIDDACTIGVDLSLKEEAR
ncbi:MAG: YceI family protein [Myxococcales bacterium]